MRVTERERKQYLKEIQKQLVCSGKQRKQFLDAFSDNMDEYLKDNPDASLSDLQEAMGTPQEIAENFLANESPAHIKKRMGIVKWVIVGIVAALVIFIIYLTAILIDAHQAIRGHGKEEIVDEIIIEE